MNSWNNDLKNEDFQVVLHAFPAATVAFSLKRKFCTKENLAQKTWYSLKFIFFTTTRACAKWIFTTSLLHKIIISFLQLNIINEIKLWSARTHIQILILISSKFAIHRQVVWHNVCVHNESCAFLPLALLRWIKSIAINMSRYVLCCYTSHRTDATWLHLYIIYIYILMVMVVVVMRIAVVTLAVT